MNRAATALLTTALTLGALTACTGSPGPTTTASTTPTATTTRAAPTPTTPPPSPTVTTPSPTPTLSPDQEAALDVVLELYRLQNQFGMDDTLMDYTPLTKITTGNAQWQTIDEIERYRLQGAIQTAPLKVTPGKVAEPRVDSAGMTLIAVSVCVDATDVDMIDKATGKSVLSENRNPINVFTLDVVQQNSQWLISDIVAKPVKACS